MSNVYVGQGYLTLSLDTSIDLSGAANPRVYYTKPDGTKGYWSASISGQNIEYTFTNADLDQEGTWYVQAYCTIGGLVAWGGTTKITVRPNLST